jgi:hypothetical protein
MSSKAQYISQTMQSATKLAQAINEVVASAEVYGDMGYAVGGSNPLTDTDLTSSNSPMTAAQVTAFIALIPTIQAFWAANHAAINRLRADL